MTHTMWPFPEVNFRGLSSRSPSFETRPTYAFMQSSFLMIRIGQVPPQLFLAMYFPDHEYFAKKQSIHLSQMLDRQHLQINCA